MTVQLNTQRLYTVNEVAYLLKVSPRTVQRRIRDGLLLAAKPTGSLEWRISPDALSTYVQGNPTPADAAQWNITPPTYYAHINIAKEIQQRIDAIAQDLSEMGSNLDARVVFWLEALGYIVDIETGMVTEAPA